MRRLLQEPLVHFLLIGAALFAAWSWKNRAMVGSAPEEGIRIGQNEVTWLKETWARQWRREPTRDELRGLVTDYLREELLAREARALGLEQNDTIIRRRLAQKLEFLVEDTSRLVDPAEEELQRYYEAHPELFQGGGRIAFRQIYFDPEKRQDPVADARQALSLLAAGGAEDSQLGDRSLLEPEFAGSDRQAVASQLGQEFTDAVFAQEPGPWSGPVRSAYGVHLVAVLRKEPSHLLGFPEVRERILDRLREDKRQQDHRKYFEELLKKYEVTVDDGIRPLIGSLTGGSDQEPAP